MQHMIYVMLEVKMMKKQRLIFKSIYSMKCSVR